MSKPGKRRGTLRDVTRLDREVRTRLLGVGEDSPKLKNGALKRDELAQTLLYAKALVRKRQSALGPKLESLVHERRLGVDRSYAFRALQKMDPERRRIVEMSAEAFAEWLASRHN
jgi:hypothetical protein